MAGKSMTIMIIFNFSCFLLGLVLYIIPILKMENPTHMSGVQLCTGKLCSSVFIWVGLSECPFYIPPALPELWGSTAKISVKEPIISLALNNPRVLGSINIKTALENVKTWKLFMLQSIFLFLMICWTFGSWCRVQIFKRQNSVNLWKYRYRCYIC